MNFEHGDSAVPSETLPPEIVPNLHEGFVAVGHVTMPRGPTSSEHSLQTIPFFPGPGSAQL